MLEHEGRRCNGVDTCQAGLCVGAGSPCPGPDGDADCTETCDEGADACIANDPDFSACPGGPCQAGVCTP